MKVGKAIERADSRKPNAFSEEEKLEWLAALEGRIAAEIFLMAPAEVRSLLETEQDPEAELLVDAPFDDIYVLWLAARIDEANGEYNKYSNSLIFFNDHYGDFNNWFVSLYEPGQGHIKEEILYGR